MAKVEPMGFVGRTGELIHYRVGNNYYVRKAPRKFKQTKATRARAVEFGLASRTGSALRRQLLPVIPNPLDRSMHRRLVSVLFKWISSAERQRSAKVTVPDMLGFTFMEDNHTVRKRWKTSFQVNYPSPGFVELKIPAFVPDESIKAPAGTASVICGIAAGSVDLSTGISLGNFSTELFFDFNNKPVAGQTISMKLPTPKGSLIVTGISLSYMIARKNYKTPNTNKSYIPAGIVDARYTGT
jgi:hypothetical protein